MKKVILVVVSVVVAAFVASYFLPEVYDPPPERLAVTSMIACSTDLRIAVEKALVQGASMPEISQSDCVPPIEILAVSPKGEITLAHHTYNFGITLSPSVDSSVVSWVCKGAPKAYSTEFCP